MRKCWQRRMTRRIRTAESSTPEKLSDSYTEPIRPATWFDASAPMRSVCSLVSPESKVGHRRVSYEKVSLC